MSVQVKTIFLRDTVISMPFVTEPQNQFVFIEQRTNRGFFLLRILQLLDLFICRTSPLSFFSSFDRKSFSRLDIPLHNAVGIFGRGPSPTLTRKIFIFSDIYIYIYRPHFTLAFCKYKYRPFG